MGARRFHGRHRPGRPRSADGQLLLQLEHAIWLRPTPGVRALVDGLRHLLQQRHRCRRAHITPVFERSLRRAATAPGPLLQPVVEAQKLGFARRSL